MTTTTKQKPFTGICPRCGQIGRIHTQADGLQDCEQCRRRFATVERLKAKCQARRQARQQAMSPVTRPASPATGLVRGRICNLYFPPSVDLVVADVVSAELAARFTASTGARHSHRLGMVRVNDSWVGMIFQAAA